MTWVREGQAVYIVGEVGRTYAFLSSAAAKDFLYEEALGQSSGLTAGIEHAPADMTLDDVADHFAPYGLAGE